MQKLFTLHNICKVSFEDENWSVREKEFTNITCIAGRSEIAKRLIDNTTADLGVAKYIAVGDDSTPAQETDTALTNEVRREAIKTDLSSRTNNITKVYARFARGYSLSVHEAGLFIWPDATDINGTGSLLCHSVFSTPLAKGTQEMMTIERTINIVNEII